MTREMDYNNGMLRPEELCEARLPMVLCVDVSSSMENAISYVAKAVNRFKTDICKDPKAAELVDVCAIAFNHTATVIQDWSPITQMKPVEMEAGGGTIMSAALKLAIQKLKEYTHVYERVGQQVRKPHLVILTDGMGDNIDAEAEEINRRTCEKKLLPFFLGVEGYDKATALKITGGKRVFELDKNIGYDFTGFFNVLAVSVKSFSVSAPGATPHIKEEDNPLAKKDCGVKVVDINELLS